MNVNINLDYPSLALVDAEEITILPEENLIVNFSSTMYDIKSLVISARNNNTKIEVKTEEKTIDLSDLLFGGRIEIEVSATLRGRTVKTWRVPDIILVEAPHGFDVIPEIEAIKKEFNEEISKIKKALAEIKLLIKENI
jgi:hypothetical protein